MITEVKERRVKANHGSMWFYATVRDGKVTAMTKVEGASIDSLEFYIVFLKEIIEAIKQTS